MCHKESETCPTGNWNVPETNPNVSNFTMARAMKTRMNPRKWMCSKMTNNHVPRRRPTRVLKKIGTCPKENVHEPERKLARVHDQIDTSQMKPARKR